ncbi:major facilitator superfamily transporter [Colletotrichum simmondsii]|uniref:Major facilitator superfamily transporter n=1 Tax=Colletotrichum simmondsii TaxID=703756 RepID=A0A135T406_9PEZI|nr:major facilitator superfamily transporter [Colletotrichum simmondsii]
MRPLKLIAALSYDPSVVFSVYTSIVTESNILAINNHIQLARNLCRWRRSIHTSYFQGMASLLSLPLEILQQILAELADNPPEPPSLEFYVPPFNSNPTSAILCQTCRILREIAEPVLHRHIYIPNASVKKFISLFKCWKARPYCARYTRRLTIEARSQRPEGYSHRAVTHLIDREDADFVSGIIQDVGLEIRPDWHEYDWNINVFVEVAMLLAQNAESVELMFQPKRGLYRQPFDMITEPNKTTKPILFNNLRHLHLMQPGLSTMDEFKSVLDCAPNLQGLRLDLCGNPMSVFALPPNLTSLILRRTNLSARHFQSMTSNFTTLRHLELVFNDSAREAFIIEAIAKHRNTLTSLILISGKILPFAKLKSLHKLESLTISIETVRPEDLLGSLPSSLRELRILEETDGGTVHRPEVWFKEFNADLDARSGTLPQDPVDASHVHDDPIHLRSSSKPRRTGIWALLALVLLVSLAASLYQLPLSRVIERRLCREHYAVTDPSVIDKDGNVAEGLCKVDDVQQSLAWIQGTMETAWIVGDFIMTIPLGFLAERYGRRSILCLNIVPRIILLTWAVIVGYFEQTLPTKAMIASPFFSVLGGDCVFNSITYAIASNMTDDHVLRATYFGWMSSVSYVVNLLGPALASASMSLLLWLPFWIGIALLLLAIPVISLLEESPDSHPDADDQARPLLSSPVLKAQDADSSLLRSILQRFGVLKSIVASHPRNMTLLLISFVLTSLASSDTKLLVQYISKRYHWTFASTGYLLSAKAVVNFTLLTVIIPAILRSRQNRSRHAPPELASHWMNIHYANICLIVSILGALAIAIASRIWMMVPSLFLYALGSALPVFTLSLLKSPFISPKRHDQPVNSADPESHIFSIVMMVKTSGSLLGAPLMMVLWVKSISIGGAALGIPYLVSASCYLAALLVLGRITTE